MSVIRHSLALELTTIQTTAAGNDQTNYHKNLNNNNQLSTCTWTKTLYQL